MNPEDPGLVLHDYWRSSAAYRVRIALNLKGLAYRQVPVNLVRDGGEQHGTAYREINPQGLVPALVHAGLVITQSLAICEYLEVRFPAPALLPSDPGQRAGVRSMAQAVACDLHPLNNLRVQQFLRSRLGAGDDARLEWMLHWMNEGFAALERMLRGNPATGLCCHGDEPGLADCCLIPQVYNADRFGCDMSGYPVISRIVGHCRTLPAFAAAAPENQPDAPR